jgi:hypothetical protein
MKNGRLEDYGKWIKRLDKMLTVSYDGEPFQDSFGGAK